MSEAPPIWINTDEFLRRSRQAKIVVVGLVPSLLAYGANGPFRWNPRAISRCLEAQHGELGVPPEILALLKPELRLFFVVLPDGRWAPDPAVFSAEEPS